MIDLRSSVEADAKACQQLGAAGSRGRRFLDFAESASLIRWSIRRGRARSYFVGVVCPCPDDPPQPECNRTYYSIQHSTRPGEPWWSDQLLVGVIKQVIDNNVS